MLEVKDATISASGKILIQNLSLIAPDGEITCITGPEGSGKTAFLRTLMGFLPVADGFVSVDGELLTVNSAPAFRRFMCYLPQNIDMLRYQLYPVEEKLVEPDEYSVCNTLLPSAEEMPETKPLSPDDVFRLASKIIEEAADKPIIEEAADKPILIADEPASHLSPELAIPLLQLLQQQAAQGKCVLIASRNPQLVAHANQVIDLNKFKL